MANGKVRTADFADDFDKAKTSTCQNYQRYHFIKLISGSDVDFICGFNEDYFSWRMKYDQRRIQVF